MTNIGQFIISFSVIILIVFVLLDDEPMDMTKFQLEKGYFNGQLDCVNNDIRIEKIGESYQWKISPWDSGEEPIYKPKKD